MRGLTLGLVAVVLAGCSVIVPGPGDFTFVADTDSGPRDAGPGVDSGPTDGGVDSGTDGGPTCTSPEELCGGVWFDLQSSNEHCGDCATACDTGWECRAATCVDPVLHLGVASNFSCAVRASGRVFCWGANEAGQLGTGDFATSLVPVEVTGLPDAVEVETGSTPFGGWTGSACAVRRGGEAVCWGRNDLGQLGDGTTSIRPSPVSVGTLDAALRVDVAYGSVCAVRGPSPRIVCWGDAASGVTAAPTAPAALPLTTCVDVAVGGAHACAVSMDGALYCWGQNMAGQLGDGTQADRMSALVVAGISDVIDVAAGIAHTCAVTSGGTVSCWGRADLSGTGNTTMDPITTPQTVNALSDVTAVESGDFSGTTCAIHGAPRSVSCWGFDLVVGGGAVQLTPVQVTGLENVVEVGMGTSHACAIVDGGGVVCWGNNTMGRLGDGTTDSRDTPTPALGFP